MKLKRYNPDRWRGSKSLNSTFLKPKHKKEILELFSKNPPISLDEFYREIEKGLIEYSKLPADEEVFSSEEHKDELKSIYQTIKKYHNHITNCHVDVFSDVIKLQALGTVLSKKDQTKGCIKRNGKYKTVNIFEIETLNAFENFIIGYENSYSDTITTKNHKRGLALKNIDIQVVVERVSTAIEKYAPGNTVNDNKNGKLYQILEILITKVIKNKNISSISIVRTFIKNKEVEK